MKTNNKTKLNTKVQAHGTSENKRTLVNTFESLPRNVSEKLKFFFSKSEEGNEIFEILIEITESIQKCSSKIGKNNINWEATNMGEFFMKPYKLPEYWNTIEVSYVNILISILMEGFFNEQYRISNSMVERRKKTDQLLKPVQISNFFDSISCENSSYLSIERYFFELMKFSHSEKRTEIYTSEVICQAMREHEWPKDYFSVFSGRDLPHLNSENHLNKRKETSSKGNVNTLQI